MLGVRPKVAELVFQLYGRSLHPELFAIHAQRSVERTDYRATVAITTGGHLVTWQKAGITLTEVAASGAQPLPLKRRLLSYRLAGERSDRVECRGGIRYETSFQLETVEPEVFWTFQQELCSDGGRHGILHRFDSNGRMALGAISWLNIESRTKTLFVQAFHTFPDDLAIVKSQSLFEVP